MQLDSHVTHAHFTLTHLVYPCLHTNPHAFTDTHVHTLAQAHLIQRDCSSIPGG